MLTVQGSYELRIDLEDFDNGTAFAHYGSFGVGLFSVDAEEDGYPVSIADYSGTAGKAAGQGNARGPMGWGGVRSHQAPSLGCWQSPPALVAASLQPWGAQGRRGAAVGYLQGR